MTERSILDGLRVIDLSRGIPGPMAALQLSEAGADVVRIEPPGGDPEQGEALHSVLNRGKRRFALDLTTDRPDPAMDRLLAGADVLIHDLTPDAAHKRGLDDDQMRARFPRLIVSAVTGWPADHPKAESPARETLVLAALGLLDEQPGHRPGPIFVRMPFASWMAGWLCAIAVVARLIARARDGRGGGAHTSLAQAALAPMTMHWSRAELPTPVFAKGLSKTIPIPLHQASDGRWVHVHYSPDHAPWMASALAEMGPDAVRAANAGHPPSHVAPNFGANRLIIATRPAADWVRHFWEHDVAAQIAVPLGEIYSDAQARANGFAVEVEDRVSGRNIQPGVPYSVEPPSRVRGGIEPLVQQLDLLELDWPASSLGFGAHPAPRPPLDGLHVLDLGAYLAGPFATMMLADLGADVIKVEPPKGDAMRRLDRQFTGIQRGKRGLALKLGEPASQEATAALARWADVVHHNIRRPAARKLGIDYETLKTERPGLIYCHVSSYGPFGERADWPGFDQLFQAACGWEIENGGTGNPPLWLRFGVMDFYGALASVFATLLGLVERQASGSGQAVSASLLGGAMLTMAECVQHADGSLTGIAHLDQDQTGVSAEHRLYRTRSGWIAVAAFGVDETASFHALVGPHAAAWFAAIDGETAKRHLDAAGVPAELVREAQMDAFLDSAANAAAGLVAEYPHRDLGLVRQVGGLWNFGDLPLAIEAAAPALGEHSDAILTEIGLAGRIGALRAAGLVV